jgi:hypothetical protein
VDSRLRLKCEGTRAETRLRLSPKRTSPFKSAGASVQSTAGSGGARISVSNAGYTTFRGSVRVLATHSICQFPLHFPFRASPCAIRFQTLSTTEYKRKSFLLVVNTTSITCLLNLLLTDFKQTYNVYNEVWKVLHVEFQETP